MSERDIGQEILEGIRELKAYKAGEIELKSRELVEPPVPKGVRGKLHYIRQLTSAAFTIIRRVGS